MSVNPASDPSRFAENSKGKTFDGVVLDSSEESEEDHRGDQAQEQCTATFGLFDAEKEAKKSKDWPQPNGEQGNCTCDGGAGEDPVMPSVEKPVDRAGEWFVESPPPEYGIHDSFSVNDVVRAIHICDCIDGRLLCRL